MEKNWLDSVYSDGTAYFVSDPQPSMHEKVTISIRMYEDAPVKHVMLWTRRNGLQMTYEMQRTEVKKGLARYSCEVTIDDPRFEYRFYLVCEDRVRFYTQRGITTYMPDHSGNFVLLANYRQPSWIRDAVWYQIYPERFANGDPTNDVQEGEYTFNGHPVTKMKNWEDRPLEYEQGFCMDFFGGDLQGVREKIPYLKALGVNAIYLNPIFSAPSTHKYDCIDFFHVDKHFGGDEALAELSKALHENGMKLMLDISINHTGTANRWFNKDGEFFPKTVGAYNNPDSEERGYYFFEPGTTNYKGWRDVETLPTLNYTSEALRDAIYRKKDAVLRKWLRPPYSIDGWRFDVADNFARNGETQLADEIWPEICAAIREENPDAYIIGEDWDECSERQQGDAWDAPMNYYGCARLIRDFYGQQDLFLSHDPILAREYGKLRAEDAKELMMSYLAKMPYVMWQNQFNLIDSHDVPRFANDKAMNEGDVRGAVMMYFSLIGTPSVYYGDEAGIDGWTETVEGCRFPMPWSRDIEATPQYHLYHTLIELRKNHAAFTEGGMKFLYAKGEVMAIARFDDKEIFVTVISSSDAEQTIELPLGVLGAERNADAVDIFGHELHAEAAGAGVLRLTLAPHEAVLFRAE
ncbi:MAG: alpha-amylase family glycosyl hydrolase [Eubacterium sp.]|nr:alpha-amylase family glycosyl hydrolase [Eubacterium sp.]